MSPFKSHNLLKLSFFNYTIQIFSLLLSLIVVVFGENCETINSCECQFQNGSIIDLHSLGKQNEARWKHMPARNETYVYYYNPCYDFKIGESGDCSAGVAGCQVVEATKTYFSLGDQRSANFDWNDKKGTLHLRYKSNEKSGDNRVLNVTLICDPHAVTEALVVLGETHKELYEMTLTSRCACADLCKERGLSAGSVLVIIFLVFVSLYLFLGISYNKVVRGASGWEMIPNYEFWKELPLLVRDGCVYISSGCKAETTYERI